MKLSQLLEALKDSYEKNGDLEVLITMVEGDIYYIEGVGIEKSVADVKEYNIALGDNYFEIRV
jgi:hypothetical protein